MAFILLLLFIAVPIIEIALFIELGGWLGLWPTLGLVVLTAIIGTTLMRQQGMSVLADAQQKMAQGEPPVASLFHGLCLLLAGVLLVTPGFFTDVVGFLLLVPPVRLALGLWLWRFLQSRGAVHIHPSQNRPGQNYAGQNHDGRGAVIDGEYSDVSQPEDQSKPGPQASPEADSKTDSRTPSIEGKANPNSPWRDKR